MVSGTPVIESSTENNVENNRMKIFQFSLPRDKFFRLNSQTDTQTDKEPDTKQTDKQTKTSDIPVKTSAEHAPFAEFLSGDKIQDKVAPAKETTAENKLADSKSTEKKQDAALKLYDKNTESGTSE
jgi:hypothetical protein